MNSLLDLSQNLGSLKEITNSLSEIKNLTYATNELQIGVQTALDKASNYVIKALPISDHAKDILVDVKDSLKTKDIKSIISTAVKSSIREGLEIIGISGTSINNVLKLKDIATKGGLIENLKNSVEIIKGVFTKNKITDNFISDFFNSLKSFIQSNSFMQKLNGILEKIIEKKNEFMDKINEWKNAYNNGNFSEMTLLAENISQNKSVLSKFEDCANQSKQIQMITQMVNNKNEKLSDIQLQLCNVL